jgi:hypothetical protein
LDSAAPELPKAIKSDARASRFCGCLAVHELWKKTDEPYGIYVAFHDVVKAGLCT